MRARIARHRAQLGLADHKVSPDEAEVAAARNELRPILDAELDRLPEEYRTLVVHCYLDGKTNEAAARLLGCSVGTIKGRMLRARGLLRQRLSRAVL